MSARWKLTEKAKRIMSLFDSVFGAGANPATNIATSVIPSAGAISSSGQLTNSLTGNAITNAQHWNNAVQQRGAVMGNYPYADRATKQLDVTIRQVENGYIIEIGGKQHVAANLKEITDLLTNRVAATLLDWNP
jgi:hypothetical protein